MAQRELTGRAVLIVLLTFFAVVASVNGAMIYFATSTFGGVEVASSYKAGLQFENEVAAAKAQDARHWRVDAHLDRAGAGAAAIAVALHDAAGRPVNSVDVSARLVHPADARHDHDIALQAAGDGLYKGQTDAALSAQWDLVIEVTRGGERLFRSRSRVGLQ